MKLKDLRTWMILGVFFVEHGFAASGTGTATATIVTPIAIASTQSLQFGKMSAGTGGTVVISVAGVRTATGGVSLISTGSTQTQALFNVTGNASMTYAITLPPTAVNITAGASTMAVGTFTSNPTTTGTLSATGSQVLNVGATLTVGNAQAAGAYTGTFTVTVNYN